MEQYPEDEIRSIFYLASEHLLNYTKIDIHLKSGELIFQEVADKFDKVLKRLQQGEPIQYILGSTEFIGLTFKVDKHVLIPRQETELLVQWVKEDASGRFLRILDLGTGSGCIAVTLAVQLPLSAISACDISVEALGVAKENSVMNAAVVDFFVLNILDGEAGLQGKYDIMVSNPPYVRDLEKAIMHKNILDHEPHLALFVPDHDPLVYYKSLALLGRKFLKDGGSLYVEINEVFPGEVSRIFENAGLYGVQVRKDLNGKPRMVKGIK